LRLTVPTLAVDTASPLQRDSAGDRSSHEVIELFCEYRSGRKRMRADLLGDSPRRSVYPKEVPRGVSGAGTLLRLGAAWGSVAREIVVAAD